MKENLVEVKPRELVGIYCRWGIPYRENVKIPLGKYFKIENHYILALENETGYAKSYKHSYIVSGKEKVK